MKYIYIYNILLKKIIKTHLQYRNIDLNIILFIILNIIYFI